MSSLREWILCFGVLTQGIIIPQKLTNYYFELGGLQFWGGMKKSGVVVIKRIFPATPKSPEKRVEILRMTDWVPKS